MNFINVIELTFNDRVSSSSKENVKTCSAKAPFVYHINKINNDYNILSQFSYYPIIWISYYLKLNSQVGWLDSF